MVQQASNMKTWTRLVVDIIMFIMIALTLLIILVKKKSTKAPQILTQLALLLFSYIFISVHNLWQVIIIMSGDSNELPAWVWDCFSTSSIIYMVQHWIFTE